MTRNSKFTIIIQIICMLFCFNSVANSNSCKLVVSLNLIGQAPLIETKRTRIRRILSKEINDLVILLQDQQMSTLTLKSSDWTSEETHIFAQEYTLGYRSIEIPLGKALRIDWVIVSKDTDRIIGVFGLVYFFDTGEVLIGYGITPKYRSRGLATEVVKKVLEYTQKDLKAKSALAVVLPSNVDSVRVMQKLGFSALEQKVNNANYFVLEF